MNHADKQHGFTLIELMLAMGFVSALLIAVAMTVIQIANIYNRGLTLKEVNQAGRSISSELQRSISASAPFTVDFGVGSLYQYQDVESYYVQQAWGGRLCLGQYSYIWNYGKSIKSQDSNRNVYITSNKEIHFVKVIDAASIYCKEASKKIDPASAIELLDVGEHDLAIHTFKITTTADNILTPLINENTAGDSKTKQQLYSIQFLLGTNGWDIITPTNSSLIGSGDTIECKAPTEYGADPSYCSISQFNITARSSGTLQ